MAGKRTTPVVLLGRYTTFAGNGTFYTLPINVVAFDSLEVFVWRGEMVGSFNFEVEVSPDQENWHSVGSVAPDPEQEVTLLASIDGSWARGKVVVSGASPLAVTCYAYGYLKNRGS